MRKRRNPNFRRIGCLIVLLGVFVFLALVLPVDFWWFVLGVVLVCAGVFIIRAH